VNRALCEWEVVYGRAFLTAIACDEGGKGENTALIHLWEKLPESRLLEPWLDKLS